ncbi:nucleosidase [Corynebacterium renale]|uniref:Adenosylhomocysteine nucleosidase n=1 Tax=Corynebacterium renale TaxID=1724 RepID=A0A2A9DQ82_9CORY|nr:nucleosidase [Corynebacterium renale]PFG28325.1 adenosylhomocysteine nucleosidase [Corynebacterium renale]SQI18992.1 nucleosidase [Corynebacterium renale]
MNTPRPLFVAAVAGEAAYIPEGSRLLVTGIGLVPAAVKVARAIAEERPSIVVNLGTAGGLHTHMNGVYEVCEVFQHDVDERALTAITGEPHPTHFTLKSRSSLPKARLASGDTFIGDATQRDILARTADLADMEGAAVVAAARDAGVPVTVLKQVSDHADDTARSSWAGAVDAGARQLAQALADHPELLQP